LDITDAVLCYVVTDSVYLSECFSEYFMVLKWCS